MGDNMKRWTIDCSLTSTQALFALETLSASVEACAGYPITIEASSENCIHMALDTALPENAYRLRVSEANEKGQQVWIFGADDNALLYCCMDFVHAYLPRAEASDTSGDPYYFFKLFDDHPLPVIDTVSVPAITHRGLWMWGHCIYDYRKLFENMARLKLNEIIIWNDYLPINHREVVEAAHRLGIKVIWGFAWGWDTGTTRMDLSDNASLQRAADAVLEIYERDYADCGADGIYFQSFTETSRESLNGRLIAQVVVEWVNGIAERLLEKHPNLLLQFGLHASSVKQRLNYIAKIDPRIHIIWEDCGDFPYAYMPCMQSDPAGTRAFTDAMLSLRPGTTTGAVLKGMICLDWSKFEHQRGSYVLGCADETTIQKRLPAAKRIWRYIQSDWMTRGDMCRQTIEQLSAQNVELYALAEDGVIERGMTLPVALYAAMLWNPGQNFADMLRETARRPDVVLY